MPASETAKTLNHSVGPSHRIVHPRARVVVVEIVGEHDLASRASINDLFSKLIRQNDLLVVDVSEAEFVDSSFLHALVNAHKHAKNLKKRMRVQLGTAPIVHKAFEISGLTEYLECFSDREEALK